MPRRKQRAKSRALLRALSRTPHRRPLHFEPLEDRRMLAVVTVTTLLDTVDVNDGLTSLREAMFATNLVPGADTIEFAASLTSGGPAKITLTQGELKIADALSINGPDANLLTIDASGNDLTPTIKKGDGSRIFNIDDGLQSFSIVQFAGLTLTGGDIATTGGAIENRESLTLSLCTITGNFASVDGGAIHSSSGALSVVGTTLENNAANANGGDIWLSTSSPLTSTFSDSLIAGSFPTSKGTWIYINDGTTHVANCTFAGNVSGAGGLYILSSANSATVEFCTFANALGTDIFAANVQSLKNTVVATSIGNCLLGTFSADYCLITKLGTATVNGSNNIIGQTSGLSMLADHGGPTKTYGLNAASFAINAGDPAAVPGVGNVPPFDQRGSNYTRVFGGRIDIGAYERQNFGAVQSLVVDTLTDDLDYDLSPGHLSLREAIALANANAGFADTITFAPSLNDGTIRLSRGSLGADETLAIDASNLSLGVTIDAAGNDATPGVIDGRGSTILRFASGLSRTTPETMSLVGLTLTGADVSSGGGAVNTDENLIVRDCVITGNSAGSGGGINEVAYSNVTVLIDHSTFTNNTSSQNGGALYLSARGAKITISDSFIVANHADQEGGGILASSRSGGSFRIERTVVADNAVNLTPVDGRWGGGISASVQSSGTFELIDSKVSGNLLIGQSVFGGGINLENRGGTARIENTLIQGNRVQDADPLNPIGSGGGLRIYNGKMGVVTITDSTVTDNAASGRGGGVYILQSNDAIATSITNCTISGNAANKDGGGVNIATSNTGSATVSFSHSTIVGNTSDADGNGSGTGGGIFLHASLPTTSPTLDHSIVSGNTDRSSTAPDLRSYGVGSSFAARFSLIGNNKNSGIAESPSGAPDANGNRIGGANHGFIDAKLGPLVNNGGPTFLDGSRMLTRALLPGSPANNAGDPLAVAGVGGVSQFDQRGTPFIRVFGGRIDIGAVEFQPNPLPGDYNFNGIVDAADYSVWRDTLGSTIDLRADGNGNNIVDADDYTFWTSHFGNVLMPGAGAASVEMLAASNVLAPNDAPPSAISFSLPPSALRLDSSFRLPPSALRLPPSNHDSALLTWLETQSESNYHGRSTALPSSPVASESNDDAANSFLEVVDLAFDTIAVKG